MIVFYAPVGTYILIEKVNAVLALKLIRRIKSLCHTNCITGRVSFLLELAISVFTRTLLVF